MSERRRFPNKRRSWRGVFADTNELIGIIEERGDGGWDVYIDRRHVGVVTSPGAAKELVERIERGGGSDGRRDL